MKNNFPKISIITVNFNQAEVTQECLHSLRKISYTNTEIFVVDNASDLNQRIDPSEFPEVTFLQSEKNLGFAGGNNLAIEKAKGDFILLLNNDTIVPTDFLQPLIQTFKDHPDAGIVSPKIIYFNSNNLIQYAGTVAINPITCRGRTIGYKATDNGQYNMEYKTDLSHGACMLIKREVFEKIGLLESKYFLYYEEYDFCEMAKRAGFTIYFNGLSHILHKESVSVGKLSPLKAYYMAKNRVLFARRNFRNIEKLISISFYFFIAFPKNVFIETISGRYKNSLATIRGAFRNFVD